MKRIRIELAAMAVGAAVMAIAAGPAAAGDRSPDRHGHSAYRQVHDRHVERGRNHRRAHRRYFHRHGPVLRHRHHDRRSWQHWRWHRHRHAYRIPYVFHFRF